jgi:hypothetical protein
MADWIVHLSDASDARPHHALRRQNRRDGLHRNRCGGKNDDVKNYAGIRGDEKNPRYLNRQEFQTTRRRHCLKLCAVDLAASRPVQ